MNDPGAYVEHSINKLRLKFLQHLTQTILEMKSNAGILLRLPLAMLHKARTEILLKAYFKF